MMTKKNYEAAAKIVTQIKNSSHGWRHLSDTKELKAAQLEAKVVCTAFVLFFRDDNPMFDQERFIKACGVDL